MDIQTPIQEQLPQIRRIAKLDDVRRVTPPREVRPPEKKIIPIQKPRAGLTFFIIGLLFFLILGFELAVIYRYDKLNKRLYQISLSLKDRIVKLQNKLHYANKTVDKLVTSRKGLIRGYLNLGADYKILQYKIGDYGTISMAKSSKINNLEGELRVLNARIQAAGAQNEVLANELRGRDEHIRELTAKLINSIGEQELMIDENLRIKEEIAILKTQSVEVKDASQ